MLHSVFRVKKAGKPPGTSRQGFCCLNIETLHWLAIVIPPSLSTGFSPGPGDRNLPQPHAYMTCEMTPDDPTPIASVHELKDNVTPVSWVRFIWYSLPIHRVCLLKTKKNLGHSSINGSCHTTFLKGQSPSHTCTANIMCTMYASVHLRGVLVTIYGVRF